ncbi:putative OsmC-like protein [Pseudonocardia sediminis]|uniref:Putative OsmC-like protein n=1 Tax=Pseudonocardia sediminis TaxID=1397368 RepID=A0A4Q7V2L7_PSEST|nr:OsmC family protein [Pseudonocardia sediminis]RZT87641.1 putative OsmC-like protein [Pseudonocardia sediminis]
MPLVTFAVSGQGTGVAQTVAVDGADYTIETDAYEAFGGKDQHPSPLAYTLASLSSCNQVTSSIVAKELGVTIEHVKFDVAADFNPTTMTTGTDRPGETTFQNLRIDAQIRTDATDEQLAKLAEETERRCPVSQLFVQAGVKVTSNWTKA